MGTLMGSCWKIFPLKYGEQDRLIWRPGDVSLSRKENEFPRNQKRDVLPGFSLSVSFRCNTVRSVSSVAPENQTLVESEESDQMLVADQLKTAHVRFKLTKECAFGQHFLIVGDDPCLGLWDPSDGVRFDWSDGHVWTVELDVPCGKMIKYKFILKVDDNTILWQPGPDRVLETWETENTIIVFEDWDHPEFQDIAEEEEFIADLNDEKSLINSEFPGVAENLSKTTQDEGTDAKKLLVGTHEHSTLDDKVKQETNTNIIYLEHEERSVLEQEAPVLLPGLIPMLTDEMDKESPNEVKDEEDITEEEEFVADLNDEKSLVNSQLPTVSENLSKTAQDEGTGAKKQLTRTNEHSTLDDKVKQDTSTNINYSEHEKRSVLEQEAPVLLQGSIPMLTDELDEKSPNKVKDEELKDEHNSASLHSKETRKVVMEKEKGFRGKEQLDILGGDMQWGRGIVKKFLAILGF